MTKPLLTALHGASLELTLNRPARRNALSAELIEGLTGALRAAVADAGVRCVLLTGAPPAFCAGLDLHEVGATGRASAAHDTSGLLELYETIDNLPKPVIAAVNGPAVAGGAGLAAACDLVICAASAQLGYPGIRHGLVAPIVMSDLLRLVGERWAKFLLLTGEMLPAARAAEIGLVTEVVPDDELRARAGRWAALLAGHPPDALAQTKLTLRRLRELHGADRLEEARRLSAAVLLTDEARAGVARFLEG